jgi:transposase InsO family protein
VIRGAVHEAVAAGASRAAACAALGLDRRTLQRWRRGADGDRRKGPKRPPSNRLTATDAAKVLRTLNLPEFRDLSPHVVVALLADQGIYLASEATMYRLLRAAKQLAHRTGARPAVRRAKPREACATAPNQVWSWDISYLPTPVRGQFFRLYMVLDVFSRKIVGAAVHAEESGELAARLMAATVAAERAAPGLVLHSDNGAPMKAETMLAMLQRLGVAASFSRPSVSNDNAYSEAAFRTAKYCPMYPADGVFESLEAAAAWTADFVRWYNEKHRHSGIKFVTPAERHDGRDVAILAKRAAVYAAAKVRNPARWAGDTRDWSRIDTVRLNPDAAAGGGAA